MDSVFPSQWHSSAAKEPIEAMKAISLSGSRIEGEKITNRSCHASHVRNTESGYRTVCGGKGMFLQHMRANGIMIPDFRCVGIPATRAIEQQSFTVALLPESMVDIKSLCSASTISVHELKAIIAAIANPEQQARIQSAFSDFVAGETFYQLIQNHSSAQLIKDHFAALCQHQPEQKIIVRSSGVREDDYGDAQAGKYDSRVHCGDDIVRTCLQVMASGYRPEVPGALSSAPMALVLQHCVDCMFGGVVMSYASLKDDTMQVEYVPGQPKGAVAGHYGITPHRYAISRSNGLLLCQHTPGDVPRAFILQPQTPHGAVETLTELPANHPHTLPVSVAQQLGHQVERLENLLNSPVDVEFAVNRESQIVILQVRPVTRLCGGTRFATAMPAEFIKTGTLVSDGLCQGPLMTVRAGESLQCVPAGAIICAHHGEQWMLAPDILSAAGGFVFTTGGTGDHVAITLRQAGKPCLISSSKPPTLPEGEKQATLVCGLFGTRPGAFLLAGSAVEKLQANALPPATDFTTAMAITDHWQPVVATASRVDQQFQELTRLNTHMLDYFSAHRLLNQCLSPDNSLLLSMSPQRGQVMSQLLHEVAHLLADTESLLCGYERFLQTGLSGDPNSSRLANRLTRLETLRRSFESVQKQVTEQLQAVARGLCPDRELLSAPGNFRQWHRDCQALQNTLQKLCLPKVPEAVASIHDIVFLVHSWFVDILGEVAMASGQGVRLNRSHRLELVNFPSPDMINMLSDEDVQLLEKYGRRHTVLNLDGMSIITTEIKYHHGSIELIEHAGGDKGRTLRMTMADSFLPREPYITGKHKRFFQIAMQIHAAAQSYPDQNVHFAVNETAGKLLCEITNIASRSHLSRLFRMAALFLAKSIEMDNKLSFATMGLPSITDFATLRRSLDELCAGAHHFTQIVEFFRIGSQYEEDELATFSRLFQHHHEATQTIAFVQRMISDEKRVLTDEEFDRYQKYVRTFLVKYPLSALELVKAHSDWLDNKREALPLVKLNGKLLEYLSSDLQNDRDIVLNAVSHTPMALIHANRALWEDPEILRTAAAVHKQEFETVIQKISLTTYARNALLQLLAYPVSMYPTLGFFVWKPYGDDKEILLGLLRHEYEVLESIASEALKDDLDVVRSSISFSPESILLASPRMLQNRELVMKSISKGALGVYDHLTPTLRNDREIQSLYIACLKSMIAPLQKEWEAHGYTETLGNLRRLQDRLNAVL